jgi:hypothetical protein
MALPRELGTEPAAMWTFGGLDLAKHRNGKVADPGSPIPVHFAVYQR